MSLIFCDGRRMVADSQVTSANGRYKMPPGRSKILRGPDGSLFGAVGPGDNAQILWQWAELGMDFSRWPTDLRRLSDDESSCNWMWLDKHGRLRVGDVAGRYQEIAAPDWIGDSTAGHLMYGAVLAGADPVKAMEIAIEHCILIGPPIVVLELREAR